jgi:PAS domain S-box-containing protein
LQPAKCVSGRREARIAHCILAVLIVAVAILVQRAIWPWIQPSPFLLLVLAVVLAGMQGEWAPGLLATGFGALLVATLFLAAGQGAVFTARDACTLLLFLAVGTLVTWINVSRRRRARAASENEGWLRTTLHSIGDAVIATDRGGRVRFLNGVAERLTGWRSHQAAGRPLSDVFPVVNEATRRPVESPVERVIRARQVVGLADHTVLLARDGSERSIEDSGAPIVDDDGELAGVVLVFRDASERHQEEQRRWLLACATEVLLGSLEIEATLGEVARLLVPRAADRVSIHMVRAGAALEPLVVADHDPANADRLPAGIDEVVAGVAATGRSQLRARLMAVPLVARGRVAGAIAFVLAASSRRYGPPDLEMAEDLARRAAVALDSAHLYRDAQEAIRVRDEFLAIASHELRTPLTTLQLQLDSLAGAAERLPAEHAACVRRKLDSASRQSVRLANLVDSLLDVGRITTGRLAIHPEPMELVQVTGELAERFQAQARAAGCPLRLAAAQRRIDVTWDRLRIEQVLSKLIGNAIKYGAGRPIDIRLERAGGEARIAVRDRGIGIAPADAERIFGCFERAVSSRNYGGLGLGLFIARQIVEAHGGEIHVSRTREPGTEIVAVLPTEVAAAARRATG